MTAACVLSDYEAARSYSKVHKALARRGGEVHGDVLCFEHAYR